MSPVGRGDEHRLVEQVHPLGDVTSLDQRPAGQLPAERGQVGLPEAVADGGGLHRIPAGRFVLAGEKQTMDARHEQVTPHETVTVPVCDRRGACQPALGAAVFAERRETEPEPERRAGRPQFVTFFKTGRVPAFEDREAGLLVGGERGGLAEPLQVVEAEGALPVLFRVEGERVLPSFLFECDPGGR